MVLRLMLNSWKNNLEVFCFYSSTIFNMTHGHIVIFWVKMRQWRFFLFCTFSACMCVLYTIIPILLSISHIPVVEEEGTISHGKKGFGVDKTV